MQNGYFKYWGKVQPKNKTFHLLAFHLLDVAASGRALLRKNKNLSRDCSELLNLNIDDFENNVAFILALHDLGKLSSAFQYVQEMACDPSLAKSLWQYDASKARHDQLGNWILDQILDRNLKQGVLSVDLKYKMKNQLKKIIRVSFGHHGIPVRNRSDYGNYFTTQNIDDGLDLVEELSKVFFGSSHIWMEQLKKANIEYWPQISWYVSGLSILSDWIGSNADIFGYQTEPISLAKYWDAAKEKADDFIENVDLFSQVNGKPLVDFRRVYTFEPSPLQQWAMDVPLSMDGGDLLILEDLAGAGKTEAAFVLIQRMLATGSIDGFYFALPTKATANSMFERISRCYSQFFIPGKVPSLVLAHGSRNLNPTFSKLFTKSEVTSSYSTQTSVDQPISSYCDAWFADSKKKALLATCGVGTVDQVMKIVLSQRFHTLPLIGLYRKVLVIDEIHSADTYMTELLCELLTHHFRQGGSVILLSATLSQEQKYRFIRARLNVLKDFGIQPTQNKIEFNEAFPLATRTDLYDGSLVQDELPCRTEVEKHFRFIHHQEEVLKTFKSWQKKKKASAWIRNSVQDVLDSYELLMNHGVDPKTVIVFHSRFALIDRNERESTISSIFGKNGISNKRQGTIVLATQVLQESLDIDFDEMVIDACPIDDLIQRSGRHRRHPRNIEGALCQKDGRGRAEINIFCPHWTDLPTNDWLDSGFERTRAVYRSVSLIWLTIRTIRNLQENKGSIKFPRDSRNCIEMVYGKNARDLIKDKKLIEEMDLYAANARRVRNVAGYVCVDWSKGYSEEAGIYSDPDSDFDTIEVSTRFSDYRTQTIYIASTCANSNSLNPYAGIGSNLELNTISVPHSTFAQQMKIDTVISGKSNFERFRNENKIPQFMSIWVLNGDPNFEYSSEFGLRKTRM